MGRVRQRGTTPELAVRKAFRELGISYRLNDRGLPGSPDLVNRRMRIAVFVHGCYWHRHPGCARASTPTANADFWRAKFATNMVRDCGNHDELIYRGFDVLVIWECETRDSLKLRDVVLRFIESAQNR